MNTNACYGSEKISRISRSVSVNSSSHVSLSIDCIAAWGKILLSYFLPLYNGNDGRPGWMHAKPIKCLTTAYLQWAIIDSSQPAAGGANCSHPAEEQRASLQLMMLADRGRPRPDRPTARDGFCFKFNQFGAIRDSHPTTNQRSSGSAPAPTGRLRRKRDLLVVSMPRSTHGKLDTAKYLV